MQIRLVDPPQRPFPQPPQPQQHQVQRPMVYVYETPAWEYKVIVKNPEDESLSEDELNTLGANGWELAGVVALPTKVQFYFKRARK
jgi:hypothetical protein